MDLPNRHLAFVPVEKVTHYLLNVNHRRGRGKALEFRERGYDENSVDSMIRDLVSIARSEPVHSVRPNEYGLNYVIYGMINPPVGEPIQVRTVWFIPHGGGSPSLATAFPRGRR